MERVKKSESVNPDEGHLMIDEGIYYGEVVEEGIVCGADDQYDKIELDDRREVDVSMLANTIGKRCAAEAKLSATF